MDSRCLRPCPPQHPQIGRVGCSAHRLLPAGDRATAGQALPVATAGLSVRWPAAAARPRTRRFGFSSARPTPAVPTQIRPRAEVDLANALPRRQHFRHNDLLSRFAPGVWQIFVCVCPRHYPSRNPAALRPMKALQKCWLAGREGRPGGSLRGAGDRPARPGGPDERTSHEGGQVSERAFLAASRSPACGAVDGSASESARARAGGRSRAAPSRIRVRRPAVTNGPDMWPPTPRATNRSARAISY